MPLYWVRLPLGTPPRLQPVKDDPVKLVLEIHTIVAEKGGGLDEVFFDTDQNTAYALIHEVSGKELDSSIWQVLEVEEHDRIKVELLAERLVREAGTGDLA